jgi:hypothetical protein
MINRWEGRVRCRGGDCLLFVGAVGWEKQTSLEVHTAYLGNDV